MIKIKIRNWIYGSTDIKMKLQVTIAKKQDIDGHITFHIASLEDCIVEIFSPAHWITFHKLHLLNTWNIFFFFLRETMGGMKSPT